MLEDLPQYEAPTFGFPLQEETALENVQAHSGIFLNAPTIAPHSTEVVEAPSAGPAQIIERVGPVVFRPQVPTVARLAQLDFNLPPPRITGAPRLNRLGDVIPESRIPAPPPEELKVMQDFDKMINKLNEEYRNDETSLRYIKAIKKRVYFLHTSMKNHEARRSYYESIQELPNNIADKLFSFRLQEREEFQRLTDINEVRKILKSFKRLDDTSYITSNYNLEEIHTIANIVSKGNPLVKGMFITKLFSHPFSNNWIEIKDIWQELVNDLKNKSAINTENAASTMEKADKSMDEITALLKELVTNISFLGVALLLMQFGYNMWGSEARRKKTKQRIRGH